MEKIELSAYVDALRGEVQRCIEEGAGKDLQFATDAIELEVRVAIETEVAAKGEVKFRFFIFDASVGGDGKSASTSTQTLKMSLKPVYKGKNGPLMISKETGLRGDD
jgi:hypothetical protein